MLDSMLDYMQMLSDVVLAHPFRSACIVIVALSVLKNFRGKAPVNAAGTVVVQPQRSFLGRVGAFLTGHFLLSCISGVVGFNVIWAIISIVCAVVIMGGGGKVELADHIKAWPKSIVAKVQEVFLDKKEAIADKFLDAKDAVAGKIMGKKGDSADADAEDVSPDSDEFWGGPPDPNPTNETYNEDKLAFDALPPEKKIAIFEAAEPLQTALPVNFPDIYAPIQWYRCRIGRSTVHLASTAEIAARVALWNGDQHHTHSMDAKTRAHISRISKPPQPCSSEKSDEAFGKLPAAERYAFFNAAYKLRYPLPKEIAAPAGHSRDEQFYRVHLCPCWVNIFTYDQLKKAQDDAFEEMQAAEIAAAEGSMSRLSRATKEKTLALAEKLKLRARGKAEAVGSNLKDKAKGLGKDLKGKAEEGVKEGAKGLFWKALGY